MSRMRFAIEQALNAKQSDSTAEPSAEKVPTDGIVNDGTPPPIVVSVEGMGEQITPARPEPDPLDFTAVDADNQTDQTGSDLPPPADSYDPWEEIAKANGYAADSSFHNNVDEIDSLMDRFDEDVSAREQDTVSSGIPEISIGSGFLQHIKDIDSVDYPEPPEVEEVDEFGPPDLNSAHQQNVNRFLGEDESLELGGPAAGFVDDSAYDDTPSDVGDPQEEPEAEPQLTVDPFAIQSLTTDEHSVEDPVRAAQEVAGWYQPDDLSPEGLPQVNEQSFQKPELEFEPPEALYDPDSDFKVRDYNPDEEFGSGKKIAQTEFEASVVDSLGLPKVHAQYEQIWSGMRNGQALKSPQIFGVVTTEPELHVAAVLSHLAIMISYEMGRHVLLVDGDARQRALTNAMELEDVRGFNETCTLECGWREAVIPTSHNKLCILPSGNLTINSTQIESLFLPTMANEWREMFDIVFVDIGDAQAPLAQPLYKMCDKTFLLVRLGHTNREFADEIADQLADDGVNLSGCIVTNLP